CSAPSCPWIRASAMGLNPATRRWKSRSSSAGWRRQGVELTCNPVALDGGFELLRPLESWEESAVVSTVTAHLVTSAPRAGEPRISMIDDGGSAEFVAVRTDGGTGGRTDGRGNEDFADFRDYGDSG